MDKGNLKKEIYLTNDVIRETSKKLGVPERQVKEIVTDFLKDFKQYILETDYLAYSFLPLGVFHTNVREVNKLSNRLTTRYYREKDKKKKAENKIYADNFKMRQKRIRVETEKFKYEYPEEMSKVYLNKVKNALLKPQKYQASYYNNQTTLREAVNLQNAYAYDWYKRMNKPINH